MTYAKMDRIFIKDDYKNCGKCKRLLRVSKFVYRKNICRVCRKEEINDIQSKT